ncbi:hypothetical protein N9Z46_10420, partial [Akkermansiaceae bacterium]|nr:hypothetical protein [Akkermansiaceae bacterium]
LNLYSFMVLLGVMTRSVMTSIMLTMLVWGISAGIDWVISYQEAAYQASQSFEFGEPTISEGAASEVGTPTEEGMREEGKLKRSKMNESEGDRQILSRIETLRIIHSFFPKNSPIMASAEKKLVLDGVLASAGGGAVLKDLKNEGEFEDAMNKLTPNDSIFYSIGTSCIFSFVMLSIAGWFFCRKDL